MDFVNFYIQIFWKLQKQKRVKLSNCLLLPQEYSQEKDRSVIATPFIHFPQCLLQAIVKNKLHRETCIAPQHTIFHSHVVTVELFRYSTFFFNFFLNLFTSLFFFSSLVCQIHTVKTGKRTRS